MSSSASVIDGSEADVPGIDETSGLFSSLLRDGAEVDADGTRAGVEGVAVTGVYAGAPKDGAGIGASGPAPDVEGFAGDRGKSESLLEPGTCPPKNVSGVRRAERLRSMMA